MKRKVKNYVHYVPEFDEIVVMEKKYTSFYRDAFKSSSRGKTKLIFLTIDYLGFRTVI